MVLQADQLKAPAPGARGIKLSKKPAAELKLSKQKLVQGMIEFSLETPRTAAAAEAAAQAAASGAGAGGGGLSSAGGGLSTAKNVQKQQVVDKPAATGTVAETSPWRRIHDNGENIQEHPRLEKQRSKIASPTAASTASGNKGGDGHGTGAEWEGVTWDEDDIPEAESLGSVSASFTGAGSASLGTAGSITLGTVELASNRGDSAEPQDVLICLKGVVGARQVTTQRYHIDSS